MISKTRLEEKSWHEEFYGKKDDRNLVVPPEVLRRYLDPPGSPVFSLELMFQLLRDVHSKRVLCFGCGDENSTVLLALKGAKVFAFDISHRAMERQAKMAIANRVPGIKPIVCSADELPFAPSSFDVVFGSAILHHVPDALPGVARELRRILKPGGYALFTEPVMLSWSLQKLRNWVPVPAEISPGERQLNDDDLRVLAEFFEVQTYPFRLLARLDRFLINGPLEYSSGARRWLIYALHKLDSLLLRVPGVQRFAGTFVLKLSTTPRVQQQESSGVATIRKLKSSGGSVLSSCVTLGRSRFGVAVAESANIPHWRKQ